MSQLKFWKEQSKLLKLRFVAYYFETRTLKYCQTLERFMSNDSRNILLVAFVTTETYFRGARHYILTSKVKKQQPDQKKE